MGESTTGGLADLPDEARTALLSVAPNFRDAGAVQTTTGRQMRADSLFRTGQLAELPPQATAALTSLGIADVFDLRTAAERGPKPDTLPAHVRLVVADVLADSPVGGATALSSLLVASDPPPTIEEVNAMIGHGKAREMMRGVYRDFIRLESANTAYREFAFGVSTSAGPIAFHCTAGKDRTGWAAAILQLFVGVSESDVISNYLESSERTLTQFAPMVELFGGAGGDTDALRDLVDVKAEYLHTVIELMQQTYGDIEGYLTSGLQLNADNLEALESRLLN